MPYWRVFYHFVWGVKNRLPLIQPQVAAPLYNVIAAKASDLGASFYAISGIQDHVHLVASVPPKLSLSRFVGEIKGSSSHFINHVLRPDMEFYWQEEYGVVSFGEKNLPFVVGYVKDQEAHHRGLTMVAQLETAE